MPALTTGLPSSVKPSAPVSRRPFISVSSSPRSPRVMAPMKPTGMRASRAAVSRSAPRIDGESTTGSVFGIAITWQKPPAAAARVPVSRSSLCSWPGVRRWTCGSTNPGKSRRPSPSTTSVPAGASSVPGAPISAIRPARTSTSCGASSPVRGSSTCAARMSRSAGWRGRADERVVEKVLHAGCGSVTGSPVRVEARTS